MDRTQLHENLLNIFKSEGKFEGDLETARSGISNTMMQLKNGNIAFAKAANDVLTDLVAFEIVLKNLAARKTAKNGKAILPDRRYHALWHSKKVAIKDCINELADYLKTV